MSFSNIRRHVIADGVGNTLRHRQNYHILLDETTDVARIWIHLQRGAGSTLPV